MTTEAAIRRLPRLESHWEDAADVVVVGAGAAGISTALAAAAAGRDVVLLCKGSLGSGSTAWAQGGIAAVVGRQDSLELHARDTAVAGAGLCDAAAVRSLVSAAPREVSRLARLGADFDRVATSGRGELALTREGGHSRDRVVHAGGDASGAEVDRVLTAELRRTSVRVLENVAALDVLLDAGGTAVGVSAGEVADDGRLRGGMVHASAVVLATGGFGQAWATTTNPRGSTGDGFAMAVRAGADVRDVEFVQFHPTVLYLGPEARGQQLLITEALRGEGAVLVDDTGKRIMAGQHPAGDLAPRDVVAAAMHARITARPRGNSTHVFLDATGLGRTLLERRFPTVLAGCRAVGIDPALDVIPVAPGAHYACGGVRADLSGRTSVPGLLAVGEVACTGTHGANRLASNSLSEALVAGRRAGELLAGSSARATTPSPLLAGDAVLPASRAASAAATSRDAGVIRCATGLERLLDQLAAAPGVPQLRDGSADLTLDAVETTALHTVSTVVAAAALHRRESRGCHRRSDFPEERPGWARHVTWRLDGEHLSPAEQPRGEAAA